MDFELWPALLAGAAAGAAMELARRLPAVFGRPLALDFLQTWSAVLAPGRSPLRAVGFLFHLLLSAAAGCLYALAFDLLDADDDLWVWGLAAGAVHLSIAGFVVARIPIARAGGAGAPLEGGLFASRLGDRDTAAFVITHLAYGLALGVVYALAHSVGGVDAAF